jgi:uncharacterized membrane protein YdjX (TVP38/TMEM64 family)
VTTRRWALSWLAAAGTVALVAAVVIVFSSLHGFSTASLRHRVDAAGPAGPLVFMVLLAACVVFAPIPNTPFYIVAGVIWGPIFGSAYTMAAVVAGSTAAFLLARVIPRAPIRRLMGAEARDKIDRARLPPAPWIVFWARLFPATNFDWINYLAGMTSMRLAPFVVATAAGMAPATVATVVAGAKIEDDPLVAIGLIAGWLAVLVLTWPFAVRKWRRATGA